MKKVGWILTALAAVVIFYNAVIVQKFNEQEAKEHPFVTIFSGGANLKRGYTFTPPYSGFEIFIFGVGLVGVVLIVVGGQQEQKEMKERRRRE